MKRVILDYERPIKREHEPIRITAWIIQLILPVMVVVLAIWVLTPRMGSHPGQIPAAKAYIEDMTTALDLLQRDNGRYPTTEEGLQALITNPGNLAHWKPELYAGAPSPAIPNDPWGTSFIYRTPGMGKPYELFSAGPDGIGGTPDDIFQ